MKTVILILSLVLSLNLFADYYKDYNIGFKGGLNLNNVTLINKQSISIEKEEYKFQKHFFIGGILKFNFVYNLSLQIEANFNNKGFLRESEDTTELYVKTENYQETFYYFEIPIILSLNIWDNINIYGGLFYSKLFDHNKTIKRERKYFTGTVKNSTVDTNEYFDELNKKSYGYLFGINYVYKRFLIDFRFTKTTSELLPDIVRYDQDMVTTDDTWYRMDKLYQFQFGIGMLF